MSTSVRAVRNHPRTAPVAWESFPIILGDFESPGRAQATYRPETAPIPPFSPFFGPPRRDVGQTPPDFDHHHPQNSKSITARVRRWLFSRISSFPPQLLSSTMVAFSQAYRANALMAFPSPYIKHHWSPWSVLFIPSPLQRSSLLPSQRQQLLAFALTVRDAFHPRNQSFRRRVRCCGRRYTLSGALLSWLWFLTPSLVVSRAVNVLKGQINPSQPDSSWDDGSTFDKEKQKDDFRQYDDACDRVKEFYREQHGTLVCSRLSDSHPHGATKTQRNRRLRTTCAFVRNSSEPSEPEWAFGKLWRSSASSSTTRILM